jgi:hypothetical protein
VGDHKITKQRRLSRLGEIFKNCAKQEEQVAVKADWKTREIVPFAQQISNRVLLNPGKVNHPPTRRKR